MIIPKKKSLSKSASLRKRLLNPLTILLLSLLFFSSILLVKKKLPGTWSFIKTRTQHLTTVFYHRLFTPAPEHININISFKDLQKIEQKRLGALELGVLISEDQDFVPATIDYQNQSIPIKLRLKGDWTDHLESDKWSFRIHTKDNQAFKGMTRFSIQDPSTRNDLQEWLYLKAIKQQGLITLRYQLIDVSINGDHKGIFALEEHFSKELLENNHRREGPILKFSESQFWSDGLSFGFTPESSANLFYKSPIETFRQTKTLQNEKLAQQFLETEYLLREYRSGELPSSKVFDIDQWTTLFALSDIFGVRHGLVWHNLRFYLNPITGLIEPIAFDSLPGERITYLSLNAPCDQYELTTILKDPLFQEEYIKKLKHFSDPAYLSQLTDLLNQDIKNLTSFIRREKPYTLETNIFSENQQYVKEKLNHHPAFRASLDQQNSLLITPLQDLPFIIESVKDQQGKSLSSSLPLTIYPPNQNQNCSPLLNPLKIHLNTTPSNQPLTISYHLLGLKEKHQVLTDSWTINTSSTKFQQTSILPQFVTFNQKTNQYLIPPGNWTLFRNLTLPKNSSLYISPGTNLNLLNHSSIITHSPIHIEGTSDHPIKIHSSDNTGQGILVLNTKKESLISHTTFENLKNISALGNNITGSITFYQSPINIHHTLFTNNQSEDSLNLIDSSFTLNHVNFHHSSSDALDIDFGQGSISHSSFTNSTNDAIDISGAHVTINNAQINQAGDKGVSAGESSHLTISDTSISHAHTGIASKDLSEVHLKLITIDNTLFGLASYQKKPEYGPGHINSWGISFTNTQNPFLIEKGSTIINNDHRLPDNQLDVYQNFYAN